MAVVNGCSISDEDSYKTIMEEVKNRGIELEIVEMNTPHAQRVAVETIERSSPIKTLNCAGARLILPDVSPSRNEAPEWAHKLNNVMVG